jgi:drug/metabolite transporter (DMT)-like permease
MAAVPPESGVLVSISLNVMVFVALTLAAVWTGRLPPVHPTSIALFVAGGLAGTLVGRNLTYMSIERLGPAMSTSVRLTNSVFGLLFGLVLLRELPRTWQVIGLVIVTVGLWVGIWARERATTRAAGGADATGLLQALASSAAFGVGDTLRRMGLGLTPSPVLGAAVGASAALLAHLLWSTRRHSARWPRGAPLRRADLWGSAVCNTAAILLLLTGLRHAPVATVSVLYNLQVLVVMLAGPLMLRGQEAMPPGFVVGTGLSLAGTALILLT